MRVVKRRREELLFLLPFDYLIYLVFGGNLKGRKN